jgi:hypothetical protein
VKGDRVTCDQVKAIISKQKWVAQDVASRFAEGWTDGHLKIYPVQSHPC